MCTSGGRVRSGYTVWTWKSYDGAALTDDTFLSSSTVSVIGEMSVFLKSLDHLLIP